MHTRSYQRPCLITVIILLVLSVLSAAGVIGYRLQKARLDGQRLRNAPPTILVHTPASGESVPEGGLLTASATAAGINPIDRVELWLNGELYQEQSAPAGSPQSIRLEAKFEIEVPLGMHAIVFRAVDDAGRVGQSPPITIVGNLRENPEETNLVVSQDGVTLDDLAQGLRQDPDALAAMNPGVGGGPLPPGTKVAVPPQAGQKKSPSDPSDRPPVDVIQPAPLPADPPIHALKTISDLAVSIRDIISIAVTYLPEAPSNLVVSHEDCVVYMRWYDNAENESYFTVWMQRLGGPPQPIATLSGNLNRGRAEYKFKSPSAGAYGFWVEAGNALGTQPSEIEWIFISDLSCEDELATQLEIEGIDMSIAGPYNRAYCYLSLEGTPETRVPASEGDFVQQIGNQWNITTFWGEKNRLLVPIPSDEELTIEGRCLGQMGATPPDILGSFSATVLKEYWDGRRLELQPDTGGFSVGYKVQYHGPPEAQGAYRFTDTHLAQPEIEKVTAGEADDPADKDWAARHITLEWSWAGDPDEIWGFVIYLDGVETRTVPKQNRQESFLLGTSCGSEIEFQVAAFGPGGSQSPPSATYPYIQPPCEVYASVTFETIQTGYTDDCVWLDCPYLSSGTDINVPVTGPCDALSAYYNIWATSATEVIEHYWGNDVYLHFTCNTKYYFDQIGDKDTLVVPIDAQDPRLRFGTRFRDYDFWGDDDIAVIGKEVYNTLEDWPEYDETFKFNIHNDEAWTVTTIRVRGFQGADINP